MLTRIPFARCAFAAAGVGALLATSSARGAEPEPAAVAAHVAAAKAAAGQDWDALFTLLCAPPPAQQQAAQQQAAQQPGASSAPAASAPVAKAAPPARDTWYAAPVQVFDNLYFVGMSEYSAWAVTTSAGIILIDTVYDYSVEAEVVEGLRTLGLDPKAIRYAVISHAHADHVGGARFLQDNFGTKIVISADDWDLVERSSGSRPVRDVVAKDGMKLTLGDTTLRLYVTPGHTLGTISAIIPVKDHGQPHVAATWGGTAFNWLKSPEQYITADRPAAFWFRHYIDSAARLRDIAAKAGADVLLSNHTVFDNSKAKLPLLRTRAAEQPNPYIVGARQVRGYLTVAHECAAAALARLTR
jgi:metallo-beta-lactamase class B